MYDKCMNSAFTFIRTLGIIIYAQGCEHKCHHPFKVSLQGSDRAPSYSNECVHAMHAPSIQVS